MITNQHHRFVANIDILGMSSIMEKNIEEAWGILSDLIEVRGHVGKYEIACISKAERIKIADMIHSVTFSDTIELACGYSSAYPSYFTS